MNIKNISISGLIATNPIIFAFLFIVFFEYYAQYHSTAVLISVGTYLVLKVLRFTEPIKLFFHKLVNNVLTATDSKDIDILDCDEYGNVNGTFTFKHGFKKYLLKVNKTGTKCSLQCFRYESGEQTVKIYDAKVPPFSINRENAIKTVLALKLF